MLTAYCEGRRKERKSKKKEEEEEEEEEGEEEEEEKKPRVSYTGQIDPIALERRREN